MSNYEIQSIKYSLAANLYEKNLRNISNVTTHQANLIEDIVLIGHKMEHDIGGVETQLTKQPDVLSEGDKITTNTPSNGFLNLIKEKFSVIRKSEELSNNNVDGEANLVEMTSSINEAEIALKQIVTIRDKMVNGYKELLNSAF